jgi:hypothetical protein
MLSSKVDDSLSQPPSTSASPPELVDVPASDSAAHDAGSEDLVNSVDQFLREALQNPRERLSVLRMEQDIEKFIQDPTQQQMEFHQLPTSYLRLAAHRVAQHYSLQSMVLLDNNLPDSSASRIIVRKTSDARVPLIRLAEIPANLPTEDNNGTGVVKVAIKQRPQKRSQGTNSSNANSSKNNSLKSVEERKEEYNRARARIFSSTTTTTFKPENEARVYQNVTVGVQKVEENSGLGDGGGSSDSNGSGGGGRVSIESSSASSSRPSRSRTEKELPVARAKASSNNNNNINTINNNINNNNRVAIFRDREVERKDPDFDRSYDRYAQRFDPGFGFNGAGYTIQPMYAPVVNYNTEFPQLGGGHRPPPDQHHQQQHHRPLPQHLPPGGWAGGYGPQETMMGPPYSHHHHHVGPPSPLYMHSAQYPCQRPGMPFIHPHDHLHQSYLQSQQQQQQHDAGFGLARPR